MNRRETMAEQDERDTKQSNKQTRLTALPDAGEILQRARLTSLQQLKASRDELDAGVPKILALTPEQRRHLSATAHGAEMVLGVESNLGVGLIGGRIKD